MICGIYKITNLVNNKVYIGQSIDIEKRWQKHKNYYKNQESHNYKLYRAISKYGLKNFSFEVIEECSRDMLNAQEIYWIKFFNSYEKGYNMTLGGSNLNGTNDKVVYQYNSQGEYITKYKSAHEAERNTGIQFTNICKVCRGERQSAGGYIWRYENSDLEIKPINIRIVRFTPVLQFDKNNNFIAEYASIQEASRSTNINSIGISKVCKNKQKTAGGYIWKLKI